MPLAAYAPYDNAHYVLASWFDDDRSRVILTFYPDDLPGLREAVRLLEQIEAEQPPADKAVA